MVATGAFLMASVMTMASPVHAATLHRTTSGSGGAGDPPGEAITAYYDIGTNIFTTSAPPNSGTTTVGEPAFDTAPAGADNYVTLLNAASTNLCAMIYVTDNSEELGACCGCPLSPQGKEGIPGMDRFSVKQELVQNWAVPFGVSENVTGTILVYATNTTGGTVAAPTCDPTGATGTPAITTGVGINGWILHLNSIVSGTSTLGTTTSVTEASFADDSPGDPAEFTALEAQCLNIFSHSSGAGHCVCPPETL